MLLVGNFDDISSPPEVLVAPAGQTAGRGSWTLSLL